MKIFIIIITSILSFTFLYGCNKEISTNQDQQNNLENNHLLWVKKIGNKNWYPSLAGVLGGVSTDKNGNVYIADIEYTGAPFQNLGKKVKYRQRVLIYKYSTNGNLTWCKQLKNIQSIDGLSIDTNGNIYIINEVENWQEGEGKISIIKYDNNGNVLWIQKIKIIDGDTDITGDAIKTDDNGDIYIGASTNDSQSVWRNSYQNHFIIKYDINRNLLWTRRIKSNVVGMSIYNKNLYLYDLNGFVSKYGNEGNLIWVSQLVKKDSPDNAKFLDNNGNIYLYGQDNHYPSISKYDKNGNLVWKQQIKSIKSEDLKYAWVEAISSDNNGNIYVSGPTGSTIYTGKYLFLIKYGIKTNS